MYFSGFFEPNASDNAKKIRPLRRWKEMALTKKIPEAFSREVSRTFESIHRRSTLEDDNAERNH